jgi:hypothetical protein
MLIYISVASLCVSIVLVVVIALGNRFYEKQKDPLEKELVQRRKDARGTKKKVNQLYYLFHEFMMRVPFLKVMLVNLKQSLSLIGEKDQRFLIKRAVKIITSMMIISVCLLLMFYRVTKSPLYTGVFLIFLWYVSDGYISYFVSKSHNRLLVQFLKFIGFVRQKYYEYGVVDDSIYEATQLLGKDDREMSVQGELIYDMFLDSEKDTNITKYLEVAPNPYLKMFVNFSQMTLEYGDQKTNGQSVYLMNLGFLSKNIQLEIDKRNRLNYALKSMNIIVMFPLFVMNPLKQWATVNFAPLGKFYNSPLGKYTEVLTIVVILLSMMLLNKVSSIEKREISSKSLRGFIDNLKMPIEPKYKRKWIYGISTFFLCIMIIVSIQYGAKYELKTKIYYDDQFLGGTLSNEESLLRKLESIEDYPIIKTFGERITINEYRLYRETKDAAKQWSEKEIEERVSRINEKIQLYHANYLLWWQIIICFSLSLLAYFLPEINKYINMKLREIDIDDEVAGFRSIIMMLMYNPRMSVQEILEWLESYAIFYKDHLHRCLLNIMSGEQEAIQDMIEIIKHDEMERLLYQLAMASEDIKLEEAFDELIQEKAHFFEHRKRQNERLIDRKIMIGQNIGFLPSYSLIILYMIVPMLVSSSNELNRFFEQMI